MLSRSKRIVFKFIRRIQKYNDKQVREDRKIKDNIKDVSNNSKKDLNCEIIIELGNKKYWEDKDEVVCKRMSNIEIIFQIKNK